MQEPLPRLPPEIWLRIFRVMDVQDLCSLMMVMMCFAVSNSTVIIVRSPEHLEISQLVASYGQTWE